MRQYGHTSVQMFEGYAGTSESGFADEVADEARLAREDDVFELYQDWCDGARVGGPGGHEIEDLFRSVRDRLGDLPGRIADDREVRQLLRHQARTLYPGVLNDCFYNPDRALCLANTPAANRALPILNHCQPGLCRNSVVAARHRPAIDRVIADAEAHLTRQCLSEHQRTAIESVTAGWGRPPGQRGGPMSAEDRIRAAMERLLARTAASAALTVTELAREAGVGRATVNRYPALREEFQRRAATCPAEDPAVSHVDEVATLKRELHDAKAERWEELIELRRTVARYANQIQALEAELAELRVRTGEVTSLADRNQGRRGSRPSE
jgi:hypothetical protein